MSFLYLFACLLAAVSSCTEKALKGPGMRFYYHTSGNYTGSFAREHFLCSPGLPKLLLLFFLIFTFAPFVRVFLSKPLARTIVLLEIAVSAGETNCQCTPYVYVLIRDTICIDCLSRKVRKGRARKKKRKL